MKADEIINRISHNTVSSNLVYPSLKEYLRVCKVDDKWLADKLAFNFCINYKTARIENKYAIAMNGEIYYNHDGGNWLLRKI